MVERLGEGRLVEENLNKEGRILLRIHKAWLDMINSGNDYDPRYIYFKAFYADQKHE